MSLFLWNPLVISALSVRTGPHAVTEESGRTSAEGENWPGRGG